MPSAIAAAASVRRRERSAVRAHPAVPHGDRGDQSRAQRVRLPRPGRRARGRGAYRRAGGRRRRSRSALGRAVRGEGPRRLRRHADDARLALVPRPAARRARLAPRRADARRRRDPDRQDRRSGVRDLRVTPRAPRSVSPATRGTRSAHPGARAAAPRPRSPSGMVPFATASDGGGSTRTPAGFCGPRRFEAVVRTHPRRRRLTGTRRPRCRACSRRPSPTVRACST